MKTWRWIEKCLLVAGIAMLGIWVWSEVRYVVWQDWENWVFNRELRQQPATIAEYLAEKRDRLTTEARAWLGKPMMPGRQAPSPRVIPSTVPPTAMEHNGLVGRLTIPRLHLTATVREGVGEDTLALALGHIPTTALPGQHGNVGVAGHRDKLFRILREIRQNDLIQFETLAGNYVYQVGSTDIVKPSDVSVLKSTRSSELTLVTCYPFYYVGSAPDRFIVKAHQLASRPSHQDLSKMPTEVTQQNGQAAPASEGTDKGATRGQRYMRRVSGNPNRANYTIGTSRISFNVPKNHSRQLAPGISFGVTDTDVTSHLVNGWMWLMPDRRTIWLRDHSIAEPVVFYSIRDGKRRELRITNVTTNSVAGFLFSPTE